MRKKQKKRDVFTAITNRQSEEAVPREKLARKRNTANRDARGDQANTQQEHL